MLDNQTPKRIPARQLLRKTWNKAWTKQWVQKNTPFSVPRTIVYAEKWDKFLEWLRGPSCPIATWFIVKPLNLSLSRGVRLIYRPSTDPLFWDFACNQHDFQGIVGHITSDIDSGASRFYWMAEEYISPPPKQLMWLIYDGPFNPLVRIILREGSFHFGELHIPTYASRGRGTLQGGARRICFNYRGELLQERPPVPNDHQWSIANYGTKVDVTGMVLPKFDEIISNIQEFVCRPMAPRSLFAFDGCYRATLEGPEFVCIEIEHAPNVRHLARYNGLREPK